MKKRQVNRDMREKVFKYFHFLHKEEIKDSHEVSAIVTALPDTIKASFLVDLYFRMIKANGFFATTFSEAFLLKICTLVRERKIGPDMNLNDIDKQTELIHAPDITISFANSQT